jgi:iron complex outermembrane receptor protein
VETPSLISSGAELANSRPFSLTGVPNLSPTIVTNYELAWDRALPSLNAQFRASAFSQRSTDVLSVSGNVIISPVSAFATPANIGNSDAQGLELELKGNFLENWRWGLSYRAEMVTDQFLPFAASGADYVDFQHSTPVNQLKVNLGWRQGPWEIDGYAQYQSKTFDLLPTGSTSLAVPPTALTPVSDYVSVDGRIAYRVTPWATLSLSGQNISQSTQQQTSGPKIERSVFGTLAVDF